MRNRESPAEIRRLISLSTEDLRKAVMYRSLLEPAHKIKLYKLTIKQTILKAEAINTQNSSHMNYVPIGYVLEVI